MESHGTHPNKSHAQQHHPEEDKFSTDDQSVNMIETGKDLGKPLSNIELIKTAEECAENLELERAVALYEEGLERFPNDTQILDGYSDLLI